MIKYNIEVAKHIWCCSENSDCRRYYVGELSRKELDNIYEAEEDFGVCYESKMLSIWTAYAGIVQSGERKGSPMKLNKVQTNSLAVLTTREPFESEENRIIFAVFLIDDRYEGDEREAGFVTTNSKYKIKLTLEEAKHLKFWNYYFNSSCPDNIRMGSGLHRYLSDEQAAQILRDIVLIKEGTDDKLIAIELCEHFCKINGIDINAVPEANGGLKR